MKPHSNEDGLTIIELLIALILTTFVSTATVATFQSFSRGQTVQDNVINMQQNLRSGLYLMGREFRMAGYKGPNPASASTAGITNANIDNITFSALAVDDGIDNDGDGDTDESGELTTIIYSHYDSDSDGFNDSIGRSADGAARSPVAENIQALQFYYEIDTAGIITRSTAPVAMDNIRAVEITMLAEARRNDRSYTNTSSYPTASGVTWGPYNDGKRRRLGESYINFRNQ